MPEPDDETWRVLRHVADRGTTRSFKRTINAALLLRAAQGPRHKTTKPRKVPRKAATCLGIACLFVREHAQTLQTMFHHLRV